MNNFDIEKFIEIAKLANKDTVSYKQLASLLDGLVQVVKAGMDDNKKFTKSNEKLIDDTIKYLEEKNSLLFAKVKINTEKRISGVEAKAKESLDEAIKTLKEIKEIKAGLKDGEKGEKGDKGDDGEKGDAGSPDTGYDIVDKINALPTDDDEDKIDVSHIKGLILNKKGKATVAATRLLSQLLDVNFTDIQDGDTLVWDAANYRFINSAGGGGGDGITRTIVVTSGNTTVGDTAKKDYTVFVTGAHDITLPTAVGNTNKYTIKNLHSGDITIDSVAGDVESGASIDIASEDSVDFVSDGTDWWVV